MEDKREYIRFQIEGSVSVRIKESNQSFNATLADIGIKGIGLYANEKLDLGKEAELEITTKYSDNPLIAQAKVIYTQQMSKLNPNVMRIGFEFIEIDKRSIRYIINSIQEEICNKVRNK